MSQIAGLIGHPGVTMNLYSTLVSLHVIAAIFGLGPLALLAAAVSRAPSPSYIPIDRVAGALRLVRFSLAGIFLTGAGIIALTRGALGETWWVRISFGLFVLLGLLHGLASRQVKLAQRSPAPTLIPKPLTPMLWSMCGVVVAITYLMEAKPW
jgi:hypothetical protein